MRRAALLLLAVLGLVLGGLGVLATPAYASGCAGTGGYGHHFGGGGVSVHGTTCNTGGSGGSDGPVAPVYEYAYTPTCPGNGPPDQSTGGDNLCGAATNTCPEKRDIREIGYRREVPGGEWEQVGISCRGENEPLRVPPTVTADLVGAQAFAVAPTPRASVEPNRTSYVGIPNNYFADAPDTDPVIVVLGHRIQLHFTVSEVTWHFGDGQTQLGNGVPAAALGQPGAVEHAYVKGGLYSITASTSVGVRFTLPTGEVVDRQDVFTRTSEPMTLPVSEIQALVNQVG